MTVVRRIEGVAGLLAGIFAGVGLLVYLFAPFFIGGTITTTQSVISWPEHFSVFYVMTHASGQGQRDLVAQVASMFAGYLLLALLVALAATRQARHVSLRWTVLLWLATGVLAVEVVSLSMNARDLLPPFLIPPVGSTHLAPYLLPSVAFAVVSAFAAVVALAMLVTTRLHAWRTPGGAPLAAVC